MVRCPPICCTPQIRLGEIKAAAREAEEIRRRLGGDIIFTETTRDGIIPAVCLTSAPDAEEACSFQPTRSVWAPGLPVITELQLQKFGMVNDQSY